VKLKNIMNVDYTVFPNNAGRLLELRKMEFKELSEMTPRERGEFEELQAYVDKMYDAAKDAIANCSEKYLAGERQQVLIDQIARSQMAAGSEVDRLREENRRLSEDRAYWMARAKVLESMLSGTDGQSAGAAVSAGKAVHMEYLTRMVREEMGIRLRNNPTSMTYVNDPKADWSRPQHVFGIIQSVYGKLFPEVLSRPLDPEGQEPYWQQYVKEIAKSSPQNAEWVRERIRVHVELTREWKERLEIKRTFTERTSHYLKSLYYMTSADVQQMIERIAGTIDDEMATVDWMTLDSAGLAKLAPLLPKNLNVTIEMFDDPYDRNNLAAWQAAVDLYLDKMDLLGQKEMTAGCNWSTGYHPPDPGHYNPEPLDFGPK